MGIGQSLNLTEFHNVKAFYVGNTSGSQPRLLTLDTFTGHETPAVLRACYEHTTVF